MKTSASLRKRICRFGLRFQDFSSGFIFPLSALVFRFGIFTGSFRSLAFRAVLLPGLLFFSLPAGASLHLEPYAGYGLTITSPLPLKDIRNGEEAVNYFLGSKYYQGPVFGARIGYKSLGLSFGGDIALGRWYSFYDKESLTPFLSGLYISYKFPLLFRVYASFMPGLLFPRTSFVDIAGQGIRNRDSFCPAMGGKIGVSYLSLPFMSVNLEYMPLYIKGKSCLSWSHTAAAYLSFLF